MVVDFGRPVSEIRSTCLINLLGVTQVPHNYGVRVLLSSAVEALARLRGSPKSQVIDYGRNTAIWTEKTVNGNELVPLINLRWSWRLWLSNNVIWVMLVAMVARSIRAGNRRQEFLCQNPWLRRILMADVSLSLAGGDSFGETYGLRQFFYVLLPQLIVIALGKPLVLLPQTYGPYDKVITRTLARFVFRRAALVYSRDREGIETVNNLLGRTDPKVRLAPDIGFLMEPEALDDVTNARLAKLHGSGQLVGLNVSQLLYMGGYTGANMFGLREDYPELIRKLVEFLIEERGCHVLFVAHVYGGTESRESEVALCRKLSADMKHRYPSRVSFIDKAFSHREAKALIGQCHVFIGSRMHACIAAVSQCVPTLCLGYSNKFRGVMDCVSAEIGVVDLRQATTEDVLQAARLLLTHREELREQLHERMPEVLAASGALFEAAVLQLVGEERTREIRTAG